MSTLQPIRSLLSQFRDLYLAQPQRRLFTFVDEDGRDAQTLDVHELAQAADAVSRSLRAWGLRPGDRAVLVYPQSFDFIKAYLGCLMAGVLPVPVYPPNPALRRDLAGFSRLVADCGATVALTNREYDRVRRADSVAGLFERGNDPWPDLRWYRTDRPQRTEPDPEAWHLPESLDDPAFLQYTSGSTGSPKGVVVTHGNLAHELAANVVDLELGPDTQGVFWLPQYHDMGLINVILSTAMGNAHSYLMSPLTFLRKPSVWIDVMSRTRATITSAPNFGYELAVRKTTPQQRAGWDLSSLRMAIVAAEPVREMTLTAFEETFLGCGLKPGTMYAAYGCAENTASVTNRGQGVVRLDKTALEDGRVVPVGADFAGPAISCASCGTSSKEGDVIRIVDPVTGRPCPPETTGEIWVRSSTTTSGYYNKPEVTREIFGATITGEDGTRYLRTGDIGFLLDGSLFVSGRMKDLVVIRGRNLHPADVEDSVRACHPLIRPGGIAAFGLDPASGTDQEAAGTEQLGLFVEMAQRDLTEDQMTGIAAAVRAAVYRDHQIGCAVVVLGRPGLVRKTTSGKVQRGACRQAWLDGSAESGPECVRVVRSVAGRGAGEAALETDANTVGDTAANTAGAPVEGAR
ncbi:fatty acyl-AMP ligase [Streptomyces phyllanthi]